MIYLFIFYFLDSLAYCYFNCSYYCFIIFYPELIAQWIFSAATGGLNQSRAGSLLLSD